MRKLLSWMPGSSPPGPATRPTMTRQLQSPTTAPPPPSARSPRFCMISPAVTFPASDNQRMPTSTVEDYLKHILLAEQERPGERVATGQIAARLALSPGTVTAMLKALADSGLVDYEPYGGARLTSAGQQLATHVL